MRVITALALVVLVTACLAEEQEAKDKAGRRSKRALQLGKLRARSHADYDNKYDQILGELDYIKTELALTADKLNYIDYHLQTNAAQSGGSPGSHSPPYNSYAGGHIQPSNSWADPYGWGASSSSPYSPYGWEASYDPYGWGASSSSPYSPYGYSSAYSPYGYSSAYNPYGYSSAYGPYGYSSAYDPYGYSSAYGPYGYSSAYGPYGYSSAYSPYGYSSAYYSTYGYSSPYSPYGYSSSYDYNAYNYYSSSSPYYWKRNEKTPRQNNAELEGLLDKLKMMLRERKDKQ